MTPVLSVFRTKWADISVVYDLFLDKLNDSGEILTTERQAL